MLFLLQAFFDYQLLNVRKFKMQHLSKNSVRIIFRTMIKHRWSRSSSSTSQIHPCPHFIQTHSADLIYVVAYIIYVINIGNSFRFLWNPSYILFVGII